MGRLNITKSILSITDPGTHLIPGDDELGRKLSRDCNTFAADLKRRRPDKFGFWASLPLPDVGSSLVELAYTLDELHADGICLLTNHHGRYLGDELFEPIYAELNRRKATVFIHPTQPCKAHDGGTGCTSAMPLPKYPTGMFEFLFDTARAVINLFLSKTVERYPNITFIVPHAGGGLPPLIERFASIATLISGSLLISPTGSANSAQGMVLSSDTVKETFKRQFFFDLAGFTFPDQIHGLLRYVDSSRLLFGSDYCYTPSSIAVMLVEKMDQELVSIFEDTKIRDDILFFNAQKLLTRG
ncbi:hypothetical protein MMC08_001381 [Hypocenomyce scalaris]|nr:hypothetical protein [Hypocenomyce scalaris]